MPAMQSTHHTRQRQPDGWLYLSYTMSVHPQNGQGFKAFAKFGLKMLL
jgi:hypothetical protein